MFLQALLLVGEMWLGELTRQRPKRTKFEDFIKDNAPSELRAIPYAGGTIELTPSRAWFGDFKQRAVERDSHWTDYLWAGLSAALLDTITVAYRSYIGEMFPLCFGPDAHVERITIDDRLMFQAVTGTDNAGGGFLIDDPQAWGGDQPPGEGGEYAWCDVTRGNYTEPPNAYAESLLATAPNKVPALHGISALWKRGPSGFRESGYFAAGGVGVTPKLKLWKVVIRRQPDNLATGFNKIGRHMNPMEVIYEWSTSLEYGAKIPLQYLNLDNWRAVAQQLHDEGTGWSGRIENQTSPIAVVKDVLAQIDAVDEPSPSLGLTIRLIRRTYSIGSLRVLNRDNITRVERFTPGTYEDTKNKVQVEFPDQDNNFKGRKALYIDPANQLIQGGRIVPQSETFLGVADFEQANVDATRDGRALSLPRAPLDCFVFPSWGRLTYRGEVVLFQWESPTFSIIMRVLKVTPNGPDEKDYHLELIEDQFSTGLRTFGEPGPTLHEDPGAGLDTAPPSASWNSADLPPDGLKLILTLTNTNQFEPTIQGAIIFGTYASGGQYARIYVTEPGGVQTLSPMHLVPDENSEAIFQWPSQAVGEYEFCVQTFSTRGVTNGVKVCATIDVAAIGSPSMSPSASVSPSTSPSISPSSSPSASTSPSHSASSSVSPSASLSPSSSASPSMSEPDPTAFSGPTLWVDGTGSSLPGLADGGAVGSSTNWIDRITGTRNFSQGTSANRPTLHQTGGPNGQPYIAYDSTDGLDFSNTISTLISASAYSGFTVIRPQQNGVNDDAWFCPQIIGTVNGFFGLSLQNRGSGNKFALWQDRVSPSPRTDSVLSTTTYVLNTWYIIEFWWDGTNMNIRVNQDTTSSKAYNNVGSLANSPSSGAQMDIAALYLWNTNIGSTNRDTFRAELSAWFGITVP